MKTESQIRLCGLFRFIISFRNYESIKHFGRTSWTGIGLSECLYLHRTENVSNWIQTHDHSVRRDEDHSHLKKASPFIK